MNETYSANVHIRELPRAIDLAINEIAARRGCNKWEVVRDALVYYVEKNRDEIALG